MVEQMHYYSVYCGYILNISPLCTETVCNKRFNEVRCMSESSAQQGSQRCFERVFNDEGSYNRCVSMDSLAPPTTDLPDEQGGIEQCSCTCSFLQRQAPTGMHTLCLCHCTHVEAKSW